jgi:hypothetical protein
VALSPEMRSALQTMGNAAIGVGLGMSVLGMGFVVSQFAAGQGSVATTPTPAPTAASLTILAATLAPTAPPPTPQVASSTPSVTLTPIPTPTPTPAPASSPEPVMTVAAYTSSGKRYAALRAPVDYVYLAPIAGTVRVQLYQFIDGEVRIGSAVTSLAFFPYVTIQSADRRVIYRPGALNTDTQMLIKDGERAEPGTPLFKTVGDGASSWRTFYDRAMTANVIASVAALPSGAEVDPVAFLTTR